MITSSVIGIKKLALRLNTFIEMRIRTNHLKSKTLSILGLQSMSKKK